MTDGHRFLGYGRQLIDDDDVAAVVEVLRGDLLTQGPIVPRFEAAVAEAVGARHAVAVSSGTAGLHLACLAAGIGPGDVVVTSPLTFVASANAVAYCGGEVVLADIDPEHLGVATSALQQRLAERPDAKAVLPVAFGGLAAEAEAIRSAAGGRVVIEDAAQALGGSYADGAPVGSCRHADISVFSTHPVKSITTGEGGVVTTNDDDLAARLRLLRNHGIERDRARFVDADAREGEEQPWYYEQQELGFNYRMTDIHAALGLSQLRKLDAYIARRREIAARYDDAFRRLPVELPQRDARDRSANHLYVVRVPFAELGTTRARFMHRLACHDVGSQVHFVPVYRQPFHRDRWGASAGDFPVTERHYDRALSLPLHPGLTDDEVERVVTAMSAAVGA